MRIATFISCAALVIPSIADARPTQKCNTGASSQMLVYGITQAAQSRVLSAVQNPAGDPDLHSRLGDPVAARGLTLNGLPSLTVDLPPFQDIEEVMASIRTDPVLAPFGFNSVADNMSICFSAGPLPPAVRITEYRNTMTNHYFLSSTVAENAIIESGGAGPGWVATGESFRASLSDFCSGIPRVYRFYAPGANSHFFTADSTECGGLKQAGTGWIGEGIAFGARLPVNGTCGPSYFKPVYRAYNNRWMFNDSNHRYTVRPDIYQQMIGQGWIGEGVALCVFDPN